MKTLIAIGACTLSLSTLGMADALPTLECHANIQPNGPGKGTETVKLETSDVSADETVLRAAWNSFAYQVKWNRSLTTLYMSINQDKQNISFATARVPSEDHNDSMVDISLGDGSRHYITCDMVEYRP